MNDSASYSIIIGANSGIAQALIHNLNKASDSPVIAISRTLPDDTSNTKNVRWLECDYTSDAIERIIHDVSFAKGKVKRVIICNGILHGDNFFPEKRIEDASSTDMMHVFNVNAILPFMWLQQLRPLLTGKMPCVISALSARVGSIEDNALGGWYSYRASKAALNMLIQTSAIEYARRAKNVKLIAFHPGTTDTELSKPFQNNVAPDKLFTPEFVASQLLSIMENIHFDGKASYLDWQGKHIPW